jgi:hypothetical protein
MSFSGAYTFRSALSLTEIIATLRAKTPWEWLERDSEFWGDYTSAQVSPDLIFKIFVEDDRYLAELKFEDESLIPHWEALAAPWLRQVLPHLGATDIARGVSNN